MSADHEPTPPPPVPFLTDPHPTLYPCVFDEGGMRQEARDRILGHIAPVFESASPGIGEHIAYRVVGSGASFNWDEGGDLDIQVWVNVDAYAAAGGTDPEGLIKRLRAACGPVNYPTVESLGLVTDDCGGAMQVQYYVKAGTGTYQEVRSERPYSAWDIDEGVWIVQAWKITPEFYGDLFLQVESKAKEIAEQADDLMDDLERSVREATYWQGMYDRGNDKRYLQQATEAKLEAERAHAGVETLFDAVFYARDDAYSPEGKGVADERDAQTKLLEVWGVFWKLKRAARSPLPWDSA
jgi:hypothetical protein